MKDAQFYKEHAKGGYWLLIFIGILSLMYALLTLYVNINYIGLTIFSSILLLSVHLEMLNDKTLEVMLQINNPK